MHDTSEELGQSDALSDFLRLCDPRPDNRVDIRHPVGELSLREAFDVADERAKQGQARFRRTTRWAAWVGMAAFIIFLGRLTLAAQIFEPLEDAAKTVPGIPGKVEGFLVRYLDFLLAIIAGGFVMRGVLAFRHEEWLVQRFQAERLRLLKFRMLIDPRTWTRDQLETEEWRQEVAHEVQAIRRLSHLSKDSMGLGEDVPKLPPPVIWSSMAFDPATGLLDKIVAYYRRRRLDSQIAYFLAKSDSHSWIGNRRVPPFIFFGGLAFVAFAAGLELFEGNPTAVRWFMFAGAAAPAIAAAIRTIRAAYEWDRNAERSAAMHATLVRIGRNLHEERVARTATPQNIFAYLFLAEYSLATDQREWIRLMGDAEWYG
jgi:hypothetical protein